MNKKDLSERDICSKFIGPAVKRAGWDGMMQIREEVAFTKGRIIVRGKLVTRGKAKRADYILYYKPNIPIAIIEAKDNNHSVGDGMQQALDYAVTLNIPFVFSSNGDGFVFHDRTGASMEKEATLSLDAFPSPKDLWSKYRTWKGLTPDEEAIVLQDYFDDGSGKGPATIRPTPSMPPSKPSQRARTESSSSWPPAPARPIPPFRSSGGYGRPGAKNASCFLPTATSWLIRRWSTISDLLARRWPSSAPARKRSSVRTAAEVELPTALDKKRRIDTAYEVYLGLYQAITGPEERQKLFREFSPGFFDLIVIDECHRGSAADDAAWREILEYFSGATQIGLTATPKETKYVSNIHYFGSRFTPTRCGRVSRTASWPRTRSSRSISTWTCRATGRKGVTLTGTGMRLKTASTTRRILTAPS